MDWGNRFSRTVTDRLEDSAIALMMREAAREGALMLSAGEPMKELYPVEQLRESFLRVLSDESNYWGYSKYRTGVKPLLEWTERWMREEGLLPGWVEPENIFITNGSQEGVSLLTGALLDPGDTIMVESPSYPDAFGVFRRDGVILEGVDLLPDGPDLDAMESLLATKKIKVFYTIPAYQNPTGFSTSDEKKRRILELARRFDFLIFEDDPYRNITFEASPGGTYINAAGDDERVLYLGSFSKVIAPALRIGWIVAPSPVVTVLEKLRIAGTLCLPDVIQHALHDLVSNIDFNKHLEKICLAYRVNRDAFVDSLERHAGPEGLEINIPSGGFFIWGKVPWIKNAGDFAMYAIKKGKVAVVPGGHFFPEPGKGNGYLRFSFAQVTPPMAEEGAARLARALREYRDLQ